MERASSTGHPFAGHADDNVQDFQQPGRGSAARLVLCLLVRETTHSRQHRGIRTNEKVYNCDAPRIVRRLGRRVLGGVVTTTVALPTAVLRPARRADWRPPPAACWPAGTYLAAHPDADEVLTVAGSQPTGEAKASRPVVFPGPPGRVPGLEGHRPTADGPACPVRCLGVTGSAGRARRIVPVVVQARRGATSGRSDCARSCRRRTRRVPSAARISRNLPNGA